MRAAPTCEPHLISHTDQAIAILRDRDALPAGS
jgi:hypothetical protein